MARRFQATADDFRSANRMITAGTPFRSVLAMFEHDMREDVVRVTTIDGRYRKLPRPSDARVNASEIRNFNGDPVALLARMNLGTTAILQPSGQLQEVDLRKELLRIMTDLIAASPVLTGHYRQSFRYVVDGDASSTLPRPDSFTIGGVTNIASYASTLENPTWHRVFRRVWTVVARRAREVGFDARLRYYGQSSEPTKRGWTYAIPVIEIGYLNSMRGRTGIIPVRRNRNRPRRVMRGSP